MKAFDATLRDGVTGLFGLALIAQILYEVRIFGHEPLTFTYAYRIVLIFGCALALLARGRSRLIDASVRLWIAADFAYSIADRFGFLGRFGSPGVSWGNWGNFVAYTHVLNGLLPVAAAPFLAVAATLFEAGLAATLSLGVYTRFSLAATSALTAIYVVTMSFTGGFQSQFEYAVLLICTSSLFLATAAPQSAHYSPG